MVRLAFDEVDECIPAIDRSIDIDRIMNDGYLYNWVSEANEINGYSPRLAESCYVYRKDELGVLTVELEYVD